MKLHPRNPDDCGTAGTTAGRLHRGRSRHPLIDQHDLIVVDHGVTGLAVRWLRTLRGRDVDNTRQPQSGMRRRTRHTVPESRHAPDSPHDANPFPVSLATDRTPPNCGILHKNAILNCGILHKNADLNCGILHIRHPEHYSYKGNRHTITICKENKDATA